MKCIKVLKGLVSNAIIKKMDSITIIAAIVQGITEALPVSSSMHLKLLNIRGSHTLHFITGLTGLAYLLVNRIFALELKYGYKVIFSCVQNIKLYTSKLIMLVILLLAILLLKTKLCDLCVESNGLLLSISAFNAIIILICESCARSSVNNNELPARLTYISILCNMLASIPGFSRLGTVYAGMRLIGVSQAEAIRYSTIQGIFISTIALLPDLVLGTLPQLSLSKGGVGFGLLCGIIYYGMISVLLQLDSKKVGFVILISCLYRVILPIVVLLSRFN